MNKKLLSILIAPLIAIVILFAIVISVIWTIQPRMFFFPSHDANSYNILSNDKSFKKIEINNDGGHLIGWFKNNATAEKAPLVIFYGGNAQNSSNTCRYFSDKNVFEYFEGYNFLMVDYPGYGLSDGTPSDKTMFDAALAIYDHASAFDNVDKHNIIIMGYSIGTGSATYVASQRNANGLILLAPYDCALSLYNDNVNIFHGPLKLLARYKFNSKEYAKTVKASPLIITSKSDEIIDYQFSLNLSKFFNNEPEVVVFDNILHNDYFQEQTVLEHIKGYLQNNIA